MTVENSALTAQSLR